MAPLIRLLNTKIENLISQYASSGEMFELKRDMGKYSMDAIASCAFGVDAQSFDKGKRSDFIKYAEQIFTFSVALLIKFFLIPPMFKRSHFLLRVRVFLVNIGLGSLFEIPNMEANSFFINVVESAIRVRRETKIKRNDLIDMMIEALDSSDNSEQEKNKRATDQFEQNSDLQGLVKTTTQLDDDNIIATAIVLMQAGYDTTALTMANILYELTLNPDCQKKLQEELIDADLEDYAVLQDLPYLDAVIHETLRKHPILAALDKICTKEYKMSGTNLIIKPGDTVQINAIGIQYDPKYYPNPETFNPDNFSKERKAERSPYTFLGFNQGPRICIGMRFALLEIKICISHLLAKFNFIPCEKTKGNFEVDTTSFFGGIKGGAWVKCERRKTGV